jgi:hypothetical protein
MTKTNFKKSQLKSMIHLKKNEKAIMNLKGNNISSNKWSFQQTYFFPIANNLR